MSAGSPRQRDPAERTAALAELRPDERRNEARVVEGVRDAGRLGLGAEVVAVVEDDRARVLEREHRPDVVGHRRHRPADVLVGLGPAAGPRRRRARSPRGRSRRAHRGPTSGRSRRRTARPPRPSPARSPRRCRSGRSTRAPAGGRRLARPRESLGRVVPRAGRRSRCRAGAAPASRRPRSRGRRRRSSSRPAAARHPSRRDPPSGRSGRPASRRSAAGPARRTSRTCPGGSPGSRCRSRTRRSSGRTSSGPRARARGRPPRSTSGRRGSSSRSGPAAPIRASGRPRRACRDWTSSVSSSARRAQLADDRVERVPAPRRASGPAVDDERVRILGDLRVEVVHQHPEGRFLLPATAGQLGPARSADGSRSARHRASPAAVVERGQVMARSARRSFSPSRLGPIEVSESTVPPPPIRVW